MLNTIAKRIQSRLTRQGVKVALGEIKEQCDRLISDIDNATEADILNVTEYFIKNATKLAVVSDDAATEVEETFSSVGGELETLTTEDVDIVNSVDNAINTASIQDIGSSDLYINEAALFTPNQDDQPAPLATTTKNELVANTAVSLGIQLSTTEIDQIADNFDAGSDDFAQTLEQVKGAIIAYVQHKIASNNQQIVNTINEISQVASDGFEENSQTLTNGLKQLNQQLVQQSTDFKSKLAGTLSRFKLPEAS
jgi:lipoate synthase